MCPDICISTWIEAHKYWRPAELFPLKVIGVAEAGRKKKRLLLTAIVAKKQKD